MGWKIKSGLLTWSLKLFYIKNFQVNIMNSRSNAREEFFKEDTQGKKLVVKIIIIQSDSDNLFKKNKAASLFF
jgi:hypothetical protein